ncbi:MAG: hypothetical protein C5B50_22865 [Verrucomicrobia bacterium]|nr:MAG: hypothetical protein C5B50_22865 [Verrucomicrobiota bacterium]
MTTNLIRLSFLVLLVCLSASRAFAASPQAPQILNIRTNGANLMISVKVPKGWQAVVLESRGASAAGAWIPQAVARAGLGSGKILFKVPAALKGQVFHVQGELTEPLPKKYYQGRHTFARRKSTFWRPDQGMGEVFSLAPNGALPATATPPATATASREVVESDIWKISGDTLYFFNQLRGLQVFNISNPDAPILLSTLDLPAVGEQMYLLDLQHVVLLAQDNCSADGQSQVLIVDLSTSPPRIQATLPALGWIEESRLVGNLLYVAAGGYQPGFGTNSDLWTWGTTVSSFDLSNPAAPAARSVLFLSAETDAILATDTFLFVPVTDYTAEGQSLPQVHVIDITSPSGMMTDVADIPIAGQVADKFGMNLRGDIFSVVSSQWMVNTTNLPPDDWDGQWVTTLQTFSLANPGAPAALGNLELAQGEQLFATRFDGQRAYVATTRFTDPLWVVDLSDPANPVVAGSVDVPGYETHLQPMGDRLLTLGSQGDQVSVSLFDVHDASNPALLSNVLLGQNDSWSEASYDDKALTVLADIGLILVPYEGVTSNGWADRIQLIDLATNSLTARGIIQHRFAPRRSAEHAGRVLSISNEELLSADITNRDAPIVTSDIEIAWPVNRLFLAGDYLLEIANGGAWSGAEAPAVRVAPASQPDTVIGQVDLSPMPIVGTTLQNGRLYLLQRPDFFYWWPLGAPANRSADSLSARSSQATSLIPFWPPTPTNLFLTILDVSSPPAIQTISVTTITNQNPASGTFQALWPTPDLLVWFSTGFSFWINPILDARPLGTAAPGFARPGFAGSPPLVTPGSGGLGGTLTIPGNVLGHSSPITNIGPTALTGLTGPTSARPPALVSGSFVSIPYWWPWWNIGGARLLAFDVTDASNPQPVSDFTFNPTNSWGFSKPFVAGGMIYFTHEQWNTPTDANGSSGSSDWFVSDYLDVLDYSQPASPTARPSIPVPGQLQGLSSDGSLLYLLGTAGARNGISDENIEALNACSYDGVSVYLVDSLALAQTWPRPILVNSGTVYLGRSSGDVTATNTLEAWTLTLQGHFARQATVKVSQPIYALGVFSGLLASEDVNNTVTLYDASSSSSLPQIGQGRSSGCLWLDLNNADGTLDSGLWIPLDDYGVSFVPTKN